MLLVAGLLSASHHATATAQAVTPAANLNALWNTYGDQGGHWTGGDSTVSVQLPDGRVAWLFSDTFLGTVNGDHSRPRSAPFIHNSIVVQQASQLVQTVHGGTAASPVSLVNASTADDFYWVGAATVQGSALKALYGKYHKVDDGPLGFTRTGTALVTFNLSSLTTTSVVDLPLDTRVGWGSAIVTDGGYDYIFGTEDAEKFKFAHLARAVAGNLGGTWEFWTGTAWSGDSAQSARLFSGGGTAFSVIHTGGRFVLVTQDGNMPFSPWMVAYTAPSLTGPFAGPSYLYKAPEPAASTGWQFAYDPKLHQEQATPGTLLMSYNVNSFNGDDNYLDARIYRPRFVDVTWPPPVPDPTQVPAAPTALTVNTDTAGAGRLNWSAPPGSSLTYWVYQRDVTAGQTHFSRTPTEATANSYDLGGLRDGHTYEFRVSAVNAVGEGPFSAIASAVAHVIPPQTPANLRATPGTESDVNLEWDAVTGSPQYSVFQRDTTAGETDFSETWFPNPSSTSHTVTDLVNGHSYEFRVTARNGGGESPPSNVVQATAYLAPPAAPTGLTAEPQGDGSVRLVWSAPAPDLWYWIYLRDVTAGETEFRKLDYPVVTGTEAQPGYLLNGHLYQFKVAAIGRGGLESVMSNVATGTARYDKPGAPIELTAAVQGDGSVQLSWTEPGPGLWYWVYQRDVTAGETTFTQLQYPVTTGTTARPGLLLKDHVYEFKVTAINTGGEGDASATVQATARYDRPPIPTGLTATPGDGQVTLVWTAPAESVWYWVYYRDLTAGDTIFSQLAYPVIDGPTATLGYLVNGHDYEFKVTAINTGGEGDASAVVTAKPMPPRPAKVIGLTAVPGSDGAIRLTWTAQASVYYWVYFRDITAGAPTFTRMTFPAADPTTTVSMLNHNHLYEFKVAATNLAGDGPDSDVVRATASYAVPGAPANLRGSAAGDSGVDLVWDPVGPNLYYWIYARDVTAGEATFARAVFPTDKAFGSWEGLRDSHVYEFQVRAEGAGGLGLASNTIRVTAYGGLPAPPTGLRATAGNAQVVINWTASVTPNVYYWVYYRDASTGEQFRKLDVPFGGTTATFNPLVNGHVYEFKVAATNGAGDSKPTPVVSARPVPPVPTAPQLAAIAGNGEVGLGWHWPDHAAWFWVEFRDRTAGQAGWQRLPSRVEDYAYTVRSLTNGHWYEFRVIAGNVAGESAPSNTVQARPVPPPPASPSNLRATAGNAQVALRWDPSPTPNVHYWVFFRPHGHSTWYYVANPVSGTSFVHRPLYNGFTYEYRVTAANIGGQSPPTNVVSARPFQPLPAAPSNLRVTAGHKSAQLAWDPSPSGAVNYWVYFQPEGHNDWYYFPNPVNGTSFTATNLVNGYNFSFKVTAWNPAGQSPPTNVFTVRPMPPYPVAPAWVSAWADPNSNGVHVSWAASPTPEVYYNVEQRDAATSRWFNMASTSNTHTSHPTQRETVLEYRIVAKNLSGAATSSSAEVVANIWVGHHTSQPGNNRNGANLSALALAINRRLECSPSIYQIVCFNFAINGHTTTIGDVVFYPGSKSRLNALVECEARERLDRIRRFGYRNAWAYGFNYMKHEGVHTRQIAEYRLFTDFLEDYVDASLFSFAFWGNSWRGNHFEVNANLYWGHYLGGDVRSCPAW